MTRLPRRTNSRGEGHGQRGLPGVLPADDRDETRACHDASACARSFAVFTLKNSERRITEPRETDVMGRIPTLRKRWKPIARRSPSARRPLDRGAARRPVGGAERLDATRPPAGGRQASASVESARPAPRGAAPATNGMSHATTTTGAGPLHHRGVDAAQGAEARLDVGHDLEVGRARRRRRGRWPRGAAARRRASSVSSTRRSRMRRPPTFSRPLGRPPNRVAPPPARMTPRTVSSGVRACFSSTRSMPTRMLNWVMYFVSVGGRMPWKSVGPVTTGRPNVVAAALDAGVVGLRDRDRDAGAEGELPRRRSSRCG